MKPVSAEYITLLQQHHNFLIGELYTVRLVDGTEDYFTNLDVPVTYGGHTFKANSLRFEGLKSVIQVGLKVDEQTVKISAYPGETLASADFFPALATGLLNGGYIIRQRAFWVQTFNHAYENYANAPIEVITIFTGRVSNINKLGRTYAEIQLKSPLSLLDIEMPRNTYQPSCQWSLFDSGCTLNRNDYEADFVVVTGSKTFVEVATISPETGADGNMYYQFGRILFTSGVNNNIMVRIASNSSTFFNFSAPMFHASSPGDTFKAWPGCAKTGRDGACELKYNNLPNFRAFSRVPPVKYSV